MNGLIISRGGFPYKITLESFEHEVKILSSTSIDLELNLLKSFLMDGFKAIILSKGKIHRPLSLYNNSSDTYPIDFIPKKRILMDIFELDNESKGKLKKSFFLLNNENKDCLCNNTKKIESNFAISRRSLSHLFLHGKKFITDEIINYFNSFFTHHMNSKYREENSFRHVYAFSSYFFSSLTDKNNSL